MEITNNGIILKYSNTNIVCRKNIVFNNNLLVLYQYMTLWKFYSDSSLTHFVINTRIVDLMFMTKRRRLQGSETKVNYQEVVYVFYHEVQKVEFFIE